MKRRYGNFLENRDFHKLRKDLEKKKKYAIVRFLHPNNPKSSRQQFDKHYARRTRS